MDFSTWVAERRKALGLSQAEIAERAGVHQSVWSEYENPQKQTQPRRSTVEKIADALGASRQDALQSAGYTTAPPEIPPELATIWQSVPRERQAGFLKAVRSVADAVSL